MPTQKEQLEEHSVILHELAKAVAALAESQKKIEEALANRTSQPVDREAEHREQQTLLECERVTVHHNFTEPKTFTWNAEHHFTFQPGINHDVPVIFANMYDQWLADCEEAKTHAQRLSERKSYEQQSRLLAQTKVPMR